MVALAHNNLGRVALVAVDVGVSAENFRVLGHIEPLSPTCRRLIFLVAEASSTGLAV